MKKIKIIILLFLPAILASFSFTLKNKFNTLSVRFREEVKRINEVSFIGTKHITDKEQIPGIDSAKADTVLKYAYSALGSRYVWAGSTPKGGFDCSGLLYWIYKKVGFTIIRSSRGLATMGVGIDSADATHGDVILFKGTNANTTGVGHVGVVVSKKGERLRFIHASSSKKYMQVIETTFAGTYYVKRYLGIRRILGVEPADTTQKK